MGSGITKTELICNFGNLYSTFPENALSLSKMLLSDILLWVKYLIL